MSERLLIEVVGSGRTGAELPKAGTLVVGSDAKRAGFVVGGPGVADVHCAIGRAKAGGWAVKDLGALSGTILNGTRVSAARLKAGDELRLGDVVLRVVDPAQTVASVASPAPAAKPVGLAPFEKTVLSAASAVVPPSPQPAPSMGASVGGARVVPLPNVPGYRVEKRIGRGGMGDVYLAVQTSLDRRVALKVLSARFASDAEFVRRFQAEARAAAALNHPNVVTVYDVGEDSGTHYLSMEFMERGTLEDRVQMVGRLPVDEVIAILRDAAAGLVFAEAKKIVHRDLKPANLMQNHVGQTKIADLGLATHVEAEEAQTADRKVFGTPHFMSPEQARGEKVDHRSDLYSLGATAYRLLTGHTPFEGKDAREIVRALLKDDPRAMKEFAPDLPDGIVDLVRRLMHKDVAQRMQSANELARELEQLRQRGGKAAPSATQKRGSLVPLFILLLLSGGGAWWWFTGRHQYPDLLDRLAGKTGTPPTADGGRGPTKPTTAPVATTDPERAKRAPPKPKPAKEKDDKDIQLIEANARVALLELLQRDMPANERRDELRLLAQRYQGTTAATQALQKADQITDMLDVVAKADSARKTVIDEVIGKMLAVARLEANPPEPGKSFLGMRAVAGQQDIAQDADFIAQRKEIENRVIGVAVQYAKEQMAASNRALETRDYDAAKKILGDLLPIFDLPEFPMGGGPAGVDEMFEVGRQARERYHNLAQMKDAIEAQRTREDQLAIAAGLRDTGESSGAGGLERELAALDLTAAQERLERLATRLTGPQEQAAARALAADSASARGALDTLGREFAQWRRRAFTDPREKRGVNRNAVGADAQGILYEVDGGGAPERLPWSAFGADVQAQNKLFVERLQRDWTPEEMAGIAAMLRMSAVVETIRATAKMFDAGKRANFTESNVRDMRALYEPATAWSEKAGPESKARLQREMASADVLAEALRSATESRWAAAAASIERLLTEFADTLLVKLLSDGRSIQELSGG